MTLGQKQRIYTRLVGKLIAKAYSLGYELSFGEAWRPPVAVRHYASIGKGSLSSVHPDRLGIDLNLFRDGKYLRSTEAHRELGEWWEKQHPLCRWGGRFERKDGNHYSMAHGSRA